MTEGRGEQAFREWTGNGRLRHGDPVQHTAFIAGWDAALEAAPAPAPRPEGEELDDLDMPMLRDQVGFATHGAWKRWRVEQGYPDHALIHGSGPIDCLRCERSWSVHHEDMIDWADLSEAKRQKYIVMGMAGREVR